MTVPYTRLTLSTSNSKTNEPHKYRLNLSNDLILNNSIISLAHCSIYYTWRNIKSIYNNNKFSYKHLATNKTHNITIPDGSYSIDDLNNYIHFTMIQNGYNKDVTDTFGINIYANPVFNRVTISVNNKFELNLLNNFAEFLGFDNSQLPISDKEIHGINVPQTERVNIVNINCNLVESNINYSSNTLYTFTPDTHYGTLLSVKPYYPEWTKCRNASFNYVEIWFTDQDNRPLEIEDKVAVTLHIRDYET